MENRYQKINFVIIIFFFFAYFCHAINVKLREMSHARDIVGMKTYVTCVWRTHVKIRNVNDMIICNKNYMIRIRRIVKIFAFLIV